MTLQGGTTLQGNKALGGQGGRAGYDSTRVGNGGSGGGGFGGGLYEAGGSVNATSATLAGNTASGGAGGDFLSPVVGVLGVRPRAAAASVPAADCTWPAAHST